MTLAIPAGANMAMTSSSSPPAGVDRVGETPVVVIAGVAAVVVIDVAAVIAAVVVAVVVVAGVVLVEDRLPNTGGRKSIMSSRK